MPSTDTVVVTIDGPAGAGKSTVAKALAGRLGFAYLDTGAMYRALTLKALREGVNLEDEPALAALAQRTTLDILGQSGGVKVVLDGEDVSAAIRTLEVTNKTFYIARAPAVRAIMVQWQRDLGTRRSVVVEGRDVGTVVFPSARYKFYLDADAAERARRRVAELQEKGQAVDAVQIHKDLQERDTKDLTRAVGPLKQAADAVKIDSTGLSVEGVVEKILSCIQSAPRAS